MNTKITKTFIVCNYKCYNIEDCMEFQYCCKYFCTYSDIHISFPCIKSVYNGAPSARGWLRRVVKSIYGLPSARMHLHSLSHSMVISGFIDVYVIS